MLLDFCITNTIMIIVIIVITLLWSFIIKYDICFSSLFTAMEAACYYYHHYFLSYHAFFFFHLIPVDSILCIISLCHSCSPRSGCSFAAVVHESRFFLGPDIGQQVTVY